MVNQQDAARIATSVAAAAVADSTLGSGATSHSVVENLTLSTVYEYALRVSVVPAGSTPAAATAIEVASLVAMKYVVQWADGRRLSMREAFIYAASQVGAQMAEPYIARMAGITPPDVHASAADARAAQAAADAHVPSISAADSRLRMPPPRAAGRRHGRI